MVSDYSEITSVKTGQGKENTGSQIMAGQVFGEFLEDLPESQEYLLLVFSPSSLPLKKRWRTNGLSANFLADYLAVFFPGDEDDPEAIDKQEQIQSTISYIANELLENAMKFSDHTAPMSIRIALQLYLSKLVFLLTNSVQLDVMQNYQNFIQEVLSSDPDEMMLHRLEQIARDNTLKSSGLGLVTMMNNYSARLGWKFETVLETPEIIKVTTMVQVSI
jgi:hypothetical protein